jgi:hypothetical protein
LPAVPARIEPLGPAPARVVPPEPSWEAFVAATCPIRELAAGDRPGDWVVGANDAGASSPEHSAESMSPAPCSLDRAVGSPNARDESATLPPDAAPARVEPGGGQVESQRFKVQFTASEEYVRLVEQAKALLSHAVPNVKLRRYNRSALRRDAPARVSPPDPVCRGRGAHGVETHAALRGAQCARRGRRFRTGVHAR